MVPLILSLWRALRFGSADITASNNGPAATTLCARRRYEMAHVSPRSTGDLRGLLAWRHVAVARLFYLIRGRIRIDGEVTGRKIERFKAVERFGHWLLAGSFILLGITGLISLFGRKVSDPCLWA